MGIGKFLKSKSHLLPKVSNMTMTFDPVILQESIPRNSCNQEKSVCLKIFFTIFINGKKKNKTGVNSDVQN